MSASNGLAILPLQLRYRHSRRGLCKRNRFRRRHRETRSDRARSGISQRPRPHSTYGALSGNAASCRRTSSIFTTSCAASTSWPSASRPDPRNWSKLKEPVRNRPVGRLRRYGPDALRGAGTCCDEPTVGIKTRILYFLPVRSGSDSGCPVSASRSAPFRPTKRLPLAGRRD